MSANPRRLGVLSNPGSGRNRRGLNDVRRLLSRYPAVPHREAGNPAEIRSALVDLASAGTDVLAVNGGDGTVQAVLTSLFNDKPFESLPRLVLLRGGTTNMNAGDVGSQRPLRRALAGLLDGGDMGLRNSPSVRRAILSVRAAPSATPRCGMFFGAGAIVRGIEYCHRNVHSKGLRDGLAPGICTLRVFLALLRGDERYVAPMRAAIATSPAVVGLDASPDPYLLVLASTLKRLFLGLRPYWGDVAGAVRFSAVRSPPRRALQTLPPLLWGRRGYWATPENGYFSGGVDRLELAMDGPYTLDGEIYQARSSDGPVQLGVAGWVTFLRD